MATASMGSRANFTYEAKGPIVTVWVSGEIDHHTAVSVRNGIDAVLFEKRPRRLVLDLSAVGFMDSSGLGLIMGRFSVMKELGGDLVVYHPSREIRGILNLAGMERIVRIECPEGEGLSTAVGVSSKATTRQGTSTRSRAGTPRSRKAAKAATESDGEIEVVKMTASKRGKEV